MTAQDGPAPGRGSVSPLRPALPIAAGTGAEDAARVGLLIVGALFLVVGVMWATLVPAFEKPDEINHLAYVEFLGHALRLPVQAKELDLLLEPETHQPPAYYAMAAAVVRLAEAVGLPHTDLEAWVGRIRSADPKAPPGSSFFSHDGIGVDSGESYPFGLTLMRMFTLLLGLVGVGLAWRLARVVLPHEPWLAVGAAALVAFLPQHSFAVSGVTNDPMAWVAASAYVLVLLSVRDRQGRDLRRTYVVLGALLGVAVLTKATLYALAPLALLARPRRVTSGEWARGLGVCAVVTSACSGWWFARNAVLYGAVLPRQEVLDPVRYAWNIAPRSAGEVVLSPGFWIPLWQSSVGRFGFMNILMPSVVYRAVFVVGMVVLVGFAGYLLTLWRSREAADARAALWSWRVIGALPLFSLVLLVSYNMSVAQPQGRYLFAALPVAAAVAAAGTAQWSAYGARLIGRLAPTRRWPLPDWAPGSIATPVLILAAALLVLNLWALFAVVVPQYGAAAWSLWPGR